MNNRIVRQVIVALLLLVGAMVVEFAASRCPRGNLLDVTPLLARGFYPREYSTTLPGPGGAVSRAYHWTQPEARVPIWPSVGAASFHIETLDPAQGHTWLAVGDGPRMDLPPAPALRVQHILVPERAASSVRVTQITPSADEGRRLGLIVSSASCQSIPQWTSWSTLTTRWPRLALGLPITLLLLGALLVALQAPAPWRVAIPAGVLAGSAALAPRWPWEIRALQPTLQTGLLFAIIGIGVWYTQRLASGRNGARVLRGVWLLSLLLFFSPSIQHDGAGYYAYLRSVLVDGDLHFSNELDATQSPFRVPNVAGSRTTTDHVPNPWSVGPAILWAPFWLLAHVIVAVGRALGQPWNLDGYAAPYIVLINLGSALAGLTTMLGCYTLARRWYATSLATLAAGSAYLGSNLLYYAMFDGSFAHSLSAATTSWFFVAVVLLDERPTMVRWLLLGLASGAMLVCYWTTALLLLAPMLVGVRHAWRAARTGGWKAIARLALGAALAAGVGLVVFSPQLVAWKIVFGSWLAIPQGASYVLPQQLRLGSVLAAPLHGLLWWTPAFFVGLLGMAWFAMRRPWPGLALLAPLVVYTLYNACLSDWHGSGAFGMRRLTVLAPLFALGLAALLHSLRRYPPLIPAFSGVLCGWGIEMTLRYVNYSIPHDVDVLSELRLSALMFRPTGEALRATIEVINYGWFSSLLRAPNLGNALILLGLALMALGSSLLWRMLRQALQRRKIMLAHI